MSLPSLVYDAWFISIASIILAVVLEPLFKKAIGNIRALYGSFSGTYIALSGEPGKGSVVVEIVKCKHIGQKILGKIDGVTFARVEQNGELVEVSGNDGQYKFNGIVDERTLVLSFHSTLRGVKGSGTLTLQGDSSGKVFTGVWSGFDVKNIASSPCIWIKADKNLDVKKGKEAILKEAQRFLTLEKSPWNTGRASVFYLQGVGGLGKTALLSELLEYVPEQESEEGQDE